MTAQYYLWYLLILPIVAINSRASIDRTNTLVFFAVIWAAGQTYWGYWADGFENHGWASIAKIQEANYLWFVINMAACLMVLWLHNLNATHPFKSAHAVEQAK